MRHFSIFFAVNFAMKFVWQLAAASMLPTAMDLGGRLMSCGPVSLFTLMSSHQHLVQSAGDRLFPPLQGCVYYALFCMMQHYHDSAICVPCCDACNEAFAR
jgi:hypothetical protein